MSDHPPPSVLVVWPQFDGATLRPFGTGLINRTFLVESLQGRWVLQKLHPVFAGNVNEDIDAITKHLESNRIVTPRVVPTGDGRLWVDGPDQRPWRVITFVRGASVDTVESTDRASEAGLLVARFHGALADLRYDYRHVRAGVHDTAKHLRVLETALDAHRSHRLYERVSAAAGPLLETARALPDFSQHPVRHAHGDLKISNLLFDGQGRGLCLVDLDTLGRMPWPHEMGDALRSWCNPAGEDRAENVIDPELFHAAVRGYAAGARETTPHEDWERLVDGLETICLELAARFLADALNETYFGWNSALYATRGEHNLVRGLGQWTLGRHVASLRSELERSVRAAFTA